MDRAAKTVTEGGCAKRIGEITVATLNNAPIVTLFANGNPVTLLLDTGAARTTLTHEAAKRIGAEVPRIEFPGQLRGVAGTLPAREVELRSFSAGDVTIPWRRVMVAPVTILSVFSTPLDGLLGADTLASFDVDLDPPNHRVAFYQRASCPPEWTRHYTAISAGRSRNDRLFFPVLVDGHKMAAFVDTGSQSTVISGATARAMGITEAMLARDRSVTTHGATRGSVISHLHRFTELRIGDEIIRNPEFLVTDIDIRDANLVLGMDYLGSRRMWLSYQSFRIFLSHRYK